MYEVPFYQVSLQDEFWTPKIDTNRKVTIPIVYQHCKETGRIDAFKLDWRPGKEPVPHKYWDSDVAKWIEAASYTLSTHPDPELDALLDEVINLILAAQQPNGYLNTYFTTVEPEKRWTNLRDDHELYCAGHLMEAAVAHYKATGKRNLLDVLCCYADYISEVFGSLPEQKNGYPGHEEIELALVKMYRVTGNERYLKLSSYFVEERGREPYYFDEEAVKRGEKSTSSQFGNYEALQAHMPVREQSFVTGHAVRAMYLYSAMADLARELQDDSFYIACDRLWRNLCNKNLYITGGIGSTAQNEGFSSDYDLPNETAYCETCAAIGLVFWSWRMLQLDCDSRFADCMEKALYNNVLSGVSLDGTEFFYSNPLASVKNKSSEYYKRSKWFNTACCPPNIARILASIGGYFYTQNEKNIAVHMYAEGEANLHFGNQNINIHQKTRYPWDGQVGLHFNMATPVNFTLRLRIPSWCRQFSLRVNGIEIQPVIKKGYACILQTWHMGDIVELDMQMPVTRVYSHPDVSQNIGCTALQRGPVVYCIESTDHEAGINRLILPRQENISAYFDPNLLSGVVVLQGNALLLCEEGWNGILYQAQEPSYTPCQFMAIPYYSWANRTLGEMKVWLPELP